MTLLNSFRPAAALSELLEKEREAIAQNDFDMLAKLLKHKEVLLRRIAQANLPERVLSPLKSQSEANNRLLVASAQGIKTARSSLASLRNPAPDLTTYGPAGATTTIRSKGRMLTHKA